VEWAKEISEEPSFLGLRKTDQGLHVDGRCYEFCLDVEFKQAAPERIVEARP
jgi:hypothetical protein